VAERIVGETPICFGVGCLISDEKAPVYRIVEFTESRLLKFAKRGVKAHERGAIAFLYTTNADQIPGDYDDHLRRNYCKQAQLGKDNAATVPVYLTMQPLTAPELDAFLQCACKRLLTTVNSEAYSDWQSRSCASRCPPRCCTLPTSRRAC
jgi:hypothetical protein